MAAKAEATTEGGSAATEHTEDAATEHTDEPQLAELVNQEAGLSYEILSGLVGSEMCIRDRINMGLWHSGPSDILARQHC